MTYHTCPHCGANLDPGETCDCQRDLEEFRALSASLDARQQKITNQFLRALTKKSRPGATNTETASGQ